MWLKADMFAQCYGFTDKFTLKFLIGTETSINMPDKEGYREGEGDRVVKSATVKTEGKFEDTLRKVCIYCTCTAYNIYYTIFTMCWSIVSVGKESSTLS